MTPTTTTGSAPATPIEQKETWLDVLGILHFVYGGLVLAGVLVAAVMVVGIGFAGIAGPTGDFEPAVLVPFALGALALAFGFAVGIVNVLAGRWLRQRRGWFGTLVVSAINCLNVPIGTLLAVFTIVLLAGDDVRALFEASPSPSPPRRPPAA